MKPRKMSGKTPAVVVVHENRGLNPYIEDWHGERRRGGISPWHLMA